DVRDGRPRAIAEAAPADPRRKARASPTVGDAPDVGSENAEDAFDRGVDFPPEHAPEPVRQAAEAADDGAEAHERESEAWPHRHEQSFPTRGEHVDQAGFSEVGEAAPGEGVPERSARSAGHRGEVERSATLESEKLESETPENETPENETL